MRAAARPWCLVLSVSVLVAAFAACTGDTPEGSALPADSGAGSGSNAEPTVKDGATDAASDAGGQTVADADASRICIAPPAAGGQVIAKCMGTGSALNRRLPDPGFYVLAEVTEYSTCGATTIRDTKWKGSAFVTAVRENEQEVDLAILPPDGVNEGMTQRVHHFTIFFDPATKGTTIRANCNSSLPIFVESTDAGDPSFAVGTPPVFGDAGLGQRMLMRLSSQADPQASNASAIFTFERAD